MSYFGFGCCDKTFLPKETWWGKGLIWFTEYSSWLGKAKAETQRQKLMQRL